MSSIETVQEAFIDFEKSTARVPDWQNDKAKTYHPEIRDHVKAGLGPLYKDDFLAGSYRRKTQSQRLKDVDIVFVLNDPDGRLAASATAGLQALQDASAACRLISGRRKRVRAVKLDLHGVEFTVDLVAALPDPEGEVLLARRLPDEGLDDWTPGRPEGQTKAGSRKNEQTAGVFVPATRIVKVWNQSFGDGDDKPMTSYMAESILHEALTAEVDYADAVLAFFDNGERHLATPVPSIPCPGDPENFVDERYEEERRVRALADVRVALGHARRAMAATTVAEALDAWAAVFGASFPAPCNNSSSLAASLRAGTATITGTRVTANGGGRQPIAGRSHHSDPWKPS